MKRQPLPPLVRPRRHVLRRFAVRRNLRDRLFSALPPALGQPLHLGCPLPATLAGPTPLPPSHRGRPWLCKPIP